MTSENRLIRLNQNGKEPGYIGFVHDITNEQSVPGLEIAPKATILSEIRNLENRMHPTLVVGPSRGETMV